MRIAAQELREPTHNQIEERVNPGFLEPSCVMTCKEMPTYAQKQNELVRFLLRYFVEVPAKGREV